ncbi:hypothetical protein [Microscilla marina]|uniref:Uncharacterized protein n=1 Tax=Microscilla marina ATCC 23134 TaxID=313606 RepID=A1ZLU1_MICM2|nr:hypothetical protein [Microscilla marina]EAY28845.1 hypothetical protein M23134_07943 [Microscilla marina ATCC 23134]
MNHSFTEVQQLVTTRFASLEAFILYLDELLERLAWAYAGRYQNQTHSVFDYDLIKSLKQALIQDLQGVELLFCPPPLPPPEPNDYNIRPSFLRPLVTSATKAHRIAKARGIDKYEVGFEYGKAVLVLDWSEQDFDDYYRAGGKIWGNYNEHGQFVARMLHLM